MLRFHQVGRPHRTRALPGIHFLTTPIIKIAIEIKKAPVDGKAWPPRQRQAALRRPRAAPSRLLSQVARARQGTLSFPWRAQHGPTDRRRQGTIAGRDAGRAPTVARRHARKEGGRRDQAISRREKVRRALDFAADAGIARGRGHAPSSGRARRTAAAFSTTATARPPHNPRTGEGANPQGICAAARTLAPEIAPHRAGDP
jgi:hypothetical protein